MQISCVLKNAISFVFSNIIGDPFWFFTALRNKTLVLFDVNYTLKKCLFAVQVVEGKVEPPPSKDNKLTPVLMNDKN